MGDAFTDRLGRLGYARARVLLAITGLAVLGLVVLVTYVRRVDTVEVVATILFVPIFLAFTYRGVLGGVAAAVAAVAGYAALRYPAIEVVGWSEFAGLLASRAAAYLIFGAVGGWAAQVLESSLDKLDLYDEVDDETGLYNARHLLRLTDLEMARADRYRTIFSIAALEIPVAALAPLRARRRRALLRALGRLLADGVRTVDHVAHARDAERHRFLAVLPETASEGAEVFRHRFVEQVGQFLEERGAPVRRSDLTSSSLTFPGDDERLVGLRDELRLVDSAEHRTPLSA